jgi:hypothetical protein
VILEKRLDKPRKNGEKSMILEASTSSGNEESSENPGRRNGMSWGTNIYATALATTIEPKKTVNIESENLLPSSLPLSNLSIKNGKSIEADTSEPIDTNIRSGIRKAA